MSVPPLLRQLPNAISIARLCAVPVLAWLAYTEREQYFTWLLVAALFSDAADGYIARTFSVTSGTGAMLDSVADAILMMLIGYGTWVFHPVVFYNHGLILALIMTLWAVEHIGAIIRYGRPSSFHTNLVRVAVMAVSVFIVVMFVIGFWQWLFYVAATLSLAAVVEQLTMLWLVDEWTPNLRGGLLEVLRRRRRASQVD
jgi:CDP-diacylglycerol--glycerol-3-phosphate 3-phosphatidyltransferase